MLQIKAKFHILNDKFIIAQAVKSTSTKSSIKIPDGAPGLLAVPFLQSCRKFIDECKVENLPKSLEALRAHSSPSVSPTKRGSDSLSKNSTTPNTTSTRSTGPYDRAFQQHLIDHDILPDGYEYPDGRMPPEPENMVIY
jgi:hypothetical protein